MKKYKVILMVQGPVFIGSNQTLRKTEYLMLKERSQLFIPDMKSFIQYLREKGLLENFIAKMQNIPNKEYSLNSFISEEKLNINDLTRNVKGIFLSYNEFKKGGQGRRPTNKRSNKNSLNDVARFIHNGNGEIYVPGSSLKGAVRTILEPFLPEMDSEKKTAIFHAISFSDSEVIPSKNMEIFQKVDMGRKQKTLSLYRECLKPDTKVVMYMTIDEEKFPFNIEQIKEKIQLNMQNYESKWLDAMLKLEVASKLSTMHRVTREGCYIYLGGGVGIVDKSPKKNQLSADSLRDEFFNRLKKKVPYNKMKGQVPENVPLVVKGTYQSDRNRFLEFGLCNIKFIEVESE